MNLFEYGRLLLRRGWIVLLLALLAGAGAFLYSRMQTPVYRATQVVLIQPARTDNGLTLATVQILNQYQEYLQSSLRAQEVVDNLQLDMLAGNLLGMTLIQPARESLTMQIDVTMTQCAVAERVAREWGNLLIQFRNEANQAQRQEDRVYAQLQDNPRCPTATTPNVTINAVAGALLGAIIGVVIVFALEYLESSIVRRREDLERALNLPVLASIPTGE